MPGRDGSGPMGMGPMTGRGLGLCSGVDAPYYGPGFRRGCGRGLGWGAGMGRGRGRGFGRGFGYGAYGFNAGPVTKEALQVHKEQLQSELDAINQRLEKL